MFFTAARPDVPGSYVQDLHGNHFRVIRMLFMTREEYEKLAVAELREQAKKLGIKGVSSLRKKELIDAVMQAGEDQKKPARPAEERKPARNAERRRKRRDRKRRSRKRRNRGQRTFQKSGAQSAGRQPGRAGQKQTGKASDAAPAGRTRPCDRAKAAERGRTGNPGKGCLGPAAKSRALVTACDPGGDAPVQSAAEE